MIPKWDGEKVHMEGVGRGEIPTFFILIQRNNVGKLICP